MGKGEEEKFSELMTVFPSFKARNYGRTVGGFMCAVHMQNMKSLVLSNGSGEEGTSTRRDENSPSWGVHGKDASE